MRYSPLASASATIDVLRRHGLYTRKSLGQHFLVDDNVVGRILNLASITSDDIVLEIGPGIGTLTTALCDTGASIVAVERDARFPAVLAKTVGECGNRFELICGDALEVEGESLSAAFGPPTFMVANLPYQIAATLVLRYFQEVPTMRAAVVMVQAEVADRMQARPGTKSYGAYTLKLALHARASGSFAVSRNSFLPPPRVDSTVIRLDRVERDTPPQEISDVGAVIAAAFAQRRKTLRNTLGASFGSGEALVSALEGAGVDPSLRAETLNLDDYLRLASEMRKYGLLA